MPTSLTTTSYAILGLLAVRPHSTYELAEQMRRALGHFWPRAESGIYAEPKKLVALGLATAREEHVGRRPRTRYAITAKGRAALRRWVPEPGDGPRIEFEQLVKVFFAEHGDRESLLNGLRRVRHQLAEQAVAGVRINRDYLEGRGPYPERLPWLILVGRFLDEIDQAVDRWSAWAITEVEGWPDDVRNAEPDRHTLQQMAANAEAFAVRLVDGDDQDADSPLERQRGHG